MRVLIILALSLVAAGETLTLRQAVEKAGELSPEIAVARLKIVEAEALEGAAKASYKPQVEANISMSRQTSNLQGIGLTFPGVPSRIGPYNVFNARPVLTQTILDGGLISSIRAARAQFEQNRYAADAVRESTQLTVLELYLQALQSGSHIEASRVRVETFRKTLQQAKDREADGHASKLDLVRAEQELRQEEVQLINNERDLNVLKTTLIRTIGLSNSDLELVPLPTKNTLPPVIAESGSAVEEVRAEFQADQANIRKAEFELQKVKREHWPRIEASTDFGVLGQHPARNVSTYTYGVTARIPIWTSGRIEKETLAAKARLDQAKESQRQTRLVIQEELRKSSIEWDAASKAVESAEKAAELAKENFELSTIRFEEGISTNLDAVVAQSRLAEAEDFAIRTRYDLLRARARNARARGNVFLFFEGL